VFPKIRVIKNKEHVTSKAMTSQTGEQAGPIIAARSYSFSNLEVEAKALAWLQAGSEPKT
jgi:hypothetical protein